MLAPPIEELALAAKRLVWKAKKEKTLKNLTPRIIRREIEKQVSLPEGTLEGPEYKITLKQAIGEAMTENPPLSDDDGVKEEESPKKGPPKRKPRDKVPAKVTPQKKRKPDADVKSEKKDKIVATRSPKKGTSKPKAKAPVKVSDDEDEPEDQESAHNNSDSEEEWGSPKKKKGKAATKPKAKKPKKVESDFEDDGEEEQEQEAPNVLPPNGKAKALPKKNENTKSKFKSLEHVPTSDMEQDEPETEVPSTSTKPAKDVKTPVKKSPAKRKLSATAAPTPDTTPRKKPTSANPSSVVGKQKSADVQVEETGNKSESELSELFSEPPKKKRKSTSTAEKKAAIPKEKKRQKAKASTLTKDEETIKRLKSLVVACGTRKVWSKVFQGIDTPQQQIKILKEILAELGMTGRMSMEQAKAIKEKRELEQELEDVQEFANKVAGRSSRSRGDVAQSTSSKGADESGDDKDEDESDEETNVPRRKTTARRSIMAFLEDQSDE